METKLQLALVIASGVAFLYPAAELVRRGCRASAIVVAFLVASLIGIAGHAIGRGAHREVGDTVAAALTIADDAARIGDLPRAWRILDFGIKSLASRSQSLEEASRAFWQYAIDESIENEK